MKKKIIISMFAAIGLLAYLCWFNLKVSEYRYLELLVVDFYNKTSFHNYANSIEPSINDDIIILKAEMSPAFEDLSLNEKYEVFSLYVTYINRFWQNNLKFPALSDYEFHVYGLTNSTIYQFNTYPNAGVLTSSILTINGETAYNSNEFQINSQNMDKDEEYTYAKEVIEYAQDFFNLLTSHGRDFHPERDIDLIFDAVQKKYGLDREQFVTLYKDFLLKIN